ncbi:FIVAR domain-containing protein, partial [Clostridiaceae bacterium NSJ-31]
AAVERVDRGYLDDLIESIEGMELEEEKYTPKSWSEFAEALRKAQEVSADDEATEEGIKAAYDELSMSVVNLKLKADKAALEAAYNLAVRMTESEEYDAESLKYVEELLAEAKAILEDGNAEQTAVDQMGKDLTTAMAKVRLSAALKKVAVSEEMLAASTEESAEAYRAALAEAEELLKAKELTWEEAKAAAENVEAMALSLEQKPEPADPVDPVEPAKPSSSKGGSTSQVSDSDYWTEVIEKINGTEKGGKVNAKLDEGANVPATVIDALKNKGVTVVFEIGGKDYAVNGAGELKGYNAAAVYYTSDEIKAMAGGAPAASGTVNAPAANSNPETGGEVAAAEPAAPEAVVPAAPVAPEVPAVIEPAAPAEAEAPAAQVAPEAESGVPVWAIVVMAIAAAAVIGGAAYAVIRRKYQDS